MTLQASAGRDKIRVEHGKGGKDRCRLLATACSLLLPQPADCRDFWAFGAWEN